MHEVQKTSDSWEALYLDKPNFHPSMDVCCYYDNELVGICAGNEIEGERTRTFSIEILAVHPLYQKKGIAKKILSYVFDKFDFNLELHLWTRSKEASEYYKNHLQLTAINSLTLKRINEEHKQYWTICELKEKNIWNFQITGDTPFLKNNHEC
jgi:GNAT superfamily N-acetyltransferase